jgi:hypothetical protein
MQADDFAMVRVELLGEVPVAAFSEGHEEVAARIECESASEVDWTTTRWVHFKNHLQIRQ